MRMMVGLLLLALVACSGGQSEEAQQAPQGQLAQTPPAAADAPRGAPEAIPVQASMMAIPDDPEAVKRLERMGYTVHREEGHLHSPGVKGCPAMADGPVM